VASAGVVTIRGHAAQAGEQDDCGTISLAAVERGMGSINHVAPLGLEMSGTRVSTNMPRLRRYRRRMLDYRSTKD
jgi:hypothetical protein